MFQVEQPKRTGKKCCSSKKSWWGGSICYSSVQSPTHLSKIIPFVTLSNPFEPFRNPFVTLSNKVRGKFFQRTVPARLYCVEYVSACLCIWECYTMGMEGYSTFSKAFTLLEPHHQIVLCHIHDTHCGHLPFCRDAVSVFCRSSRLGCVFP